MKLQTGDQEWELGIQKAVRGSEALLFCLLKKEPRENSNKNDGLFACGILHSASSIQHPAFSIIQIQASSRIRGGKRCVAEFSLVIALKFALGPGLKILQLISI
jgi:hypothetical protein